MAYLVMQIGCIECGVSSYPIRVCQTIEDARRAKEDHPSTWETEGGDGYAVIVDLNACVEVE